MSEQNDRVFKVVEQIDTEAPSIIETFGVKVGRPMKKAGDLMDWIIFG